MPLGVQISRELELRVDLEFELRNSNTGEKCPRCSLTVRSNAVLELDHLAGGYSFLKDMNNFAEKKLFIPKRLEMFLLLDLNQLCDMACHTQLNKSHITAHVVA